MVTVTVGVKLSPQMVRTVFDWTLSAKFEKDTGERSDGHYVLFTFILRTSCKQRT